MSRRRFDWNSLVCGWSGHATYLPDEPELRARLHAPTAAGDAVRCLRCGAFVPGPPRASGPASEAPLVRRGRALEDAVILRLLAVSRFFHFVGFAVMALAVWTFRSRKQSLTQTFYAYLPLLQPIAERAGINLHRSKTVSGLEHALTTAPRTLGWIVAGLVLYAGLELSEAVGLWLMQRWGEYVAATVTSLLIPLELYELAHHATVLKVVALVINLGAVAYLLWTKRLFGLRGGRAAYEAERHAESLLEVEQRAASGPGPTRRAARPTG